MAIKDYESAVRSCFKEGEIQGLWYGGTEGKIGDDPNKMYVAITEGPNWSQNRFILRDWFFDYKKFETLPLDIDCESYGVYCIWMKDQSGICAVCVAFRADKVFKSIVEEDFNGTYICEDCFTKTDMSFWDKPTPYNSNRDIRSLCPCCKINKMVVEERTKLGDEVVKVCEDCYNEKKEDNHSICPHCETKKIAVEFKTDLGDGDVMVCEDCYNEIEEEDE